MTLAAVLSTLWLPTQVIFPEPAPGPLDNPLKGWCPYTIAGPIHQPYSMVFMYVPWNELEPAEGVFRFADWEKQAWSTPLASGKHIVFRVVIDYPNRPSGIPSWLTAKGVRTHSYTDYGGGVAPDYDDSRMIAAMERLVAALGKRYDRHPRIAFVQFGLLGFWGEWHTYPRNELFASEETQRKILQAARRAFPNKVLMTRYPGGVGGEMPWVGYFDDSFPDDTDGPEEWKFLPQMRKSGRTHNWKRSVIGGEMLPRQAEKWLGENFELTMKRTAASHFSWVGPYGPAQEPTKSDQYRERSEALVRKLGYEFRLTKVVVKPGQLFDVELQGVNDGVAPFYYPWQVRLALIDANDKVAAEAIADVDIRKWLPGPFRSRFQAKLGASRGNYRLAVGVIDPWTKRPAVGFANKLKRTKGWTVLCRVQLGAR